jgi:hypothetical protein
MTSLRTPSRRDDLIIAWRFNAGLASKIRQVPKGRLTSVPKITFIMFQTVLFQQRQELLLKGHPPVMLLLVPDVFHDRQTRGLRVGRERDRMQRI